MNDLIYRQAAIDALGFYKPVSDTWTDEYEIGVYKQWQKDKKAISDLPSADAVTVVRCRDCKHYQFAKERAFGIPVKRCEITEFEDVDDFDFCSRGERRDNG